MTKFLDLRNKVAPQVRVIYKTVVTKQPWYLEFSKFLAVVLLVGIAVWGISRADDALIPTSTDFSGTGIVSSVSESSISFDNTIVSQYAPESSYTFNTDGLQRIESDQYDTLQLSDVKIGQMIIAQGTAVGSNINITRLIVFVPTIVEKANEIITELVGSTTTATTTETTLSTTTDLLNANDPGDIGSTTATTSPVVEVSTTTETSESTAPASADSDVVSEAASSTTENQ